MRDISILLIDASRLSKINIASQIVIYTEV